MVQRVPAGFETRLRDVPHAALMRADVVSEAVEQVRTVEMVVGARTWSESSARIRPQNGVDILRDDVKYRFI